MFISELDVVNECLSTMGEAPINSLQEDHVYKSSAQNYLKDSNIIEQKFGWWFNRETVELQPDATSGFIYIPNDCLKILPLYNSDNTYGQRGKRLYNINKNSYVFDNKQKVRIVRLLQFEDLPYHCADVVRYSTVIRFQREFDGDETRYTQLMVDYERAKMELIAENSRNSKANMFNSPSFKRRMLNIRPNRSSIPY